MYRRTLRLFMCECLIAFVSACESDMETFLTCKRTTIEKPSFVAGKSLRAYVVLGKRMELKISRTAKLTNQIDPYISIYSTKMIPYVCLSHLNFKCHRRLPEILTVRAGMRYLQTWCRNGRARRDELQGHKFDGRGRLAMGAAQQRSGVTETGSASATDASVGKSLADIYGSSRHRPQVR